MVRIYLPSRMERLFDFLLIVAYTRTMIRKEFPDYAAMPVLYPPEWLWQVKWNRPYFIADPDGCWEWRGTRAKFGYGMVTILGVPQVVHRITYGPIPDGLEIDHLCRNPCCVRPDHLEAVTHKVNMERGLVANKTQCRNGHEYTEKNTYVAPTGSRQCKECRNIRARARYNGEPPPHSDFFKDGKSRRKAGPAFRSRAGT